MMTSLKKRVLIFSFFALLIPLGLSALFDVQAIFDSYRQSLALRHQIHAESLRFEIEKVQNLGLPLQDMEGLNSRCQEVVQRDPDLAYCLIETLDGTTLFAHDPSLVGLATFPARQPGSAHKFSGFRDWGDFFDISVAIQDAGRNNTGWIRVGFSSDLLLEMARTTIVRNLVILVLMFLLIYGLIVIFIQRYLLTPIERLCNVAQQLTQGDFYLETPRLATRELQALADNFATMAASLAERDERIAAGIEELEHSNRLLQDAYETQEQISAELNRNQLLYQTLVDQASEAILVCNDDDEIRLFNHQAENFFGLAATEVMQRNLLSFFERLGVLSVERLYEMYQGVLHTGVGAEEFDFVTAEGAKRTGLISAVALTGGGEGKLVQMIIHDITHEHQAKLNLEKSAADLAHLNRMKNTFLGMVSHELKTPLTIILGYADLLDVQKELSIEPLLKESLGHIIEAAERLGRIIQDMVDASDLDGQLVQLKQELVDLNQLLIDRSNEVAVLAAQRDQNIALDLDDQIPAVSADVERLAQMFDHLLNNAIKFTPDKGHILIKSLFLAPGSDAAMTCSCVGDLSAGCVEIIVADTGIGIPANEREHVFDKFYGSGPIEMHTSSRVSFKGKGVGLGLTIVQGIVELHGGEVWIDNEHTTEATQYSGSAFHVRLPVRKASGI